MKITLKAENEKHREIAKMFVGCNTQSGELLGFHKHYMNGRFTTQHNSNFHTMYSQEITLDLSQAEMDLRLAIGTDIEFENIGRITHYFCSENAVYEDEVIGSSNSRRDFGTSTAKLSKNYLKKIGVEIEDEQ